MSDPNFNHDNETSSEQPDPYTFRPELYSAAEKNDTVKVLSFLAGGVKPNYIDPKTGWTPLHWAALHGNATLIKRLLEKGASAPYHRKRGTNRRHSIAYSNNKEYNEESKDVYDDDDKSSRISSQIPNEDGGLIEEKSINDYSIQDSNEDYYNDDDEDEDELHIVDIENRKKLEDKFDFTKNTPLLWASYKGHFHAVWLLLLDGYSSNDLDTYGNNPLHLAAANGSIKVVKTLINDGANANLVNIYKNLPIDMCVNKYVRDILSVAMDKYASNTVDDNYNMHKQNVKSYKVLVNNLINSINDAMKFEELINNNTSLTMNKLDIPLLMRNLDEVLHISKEWELDDVLIKQADDLLLKMELSLDLLTNIENLKKNMPITSQLYYSLYVNKVEKTIIEIEKINFSVLPITIGKELINQCQMEYWLYTYIKKLEHVTTAVDSNEHDMISLKKAIEKAKLLNNFSNNLLDTSSKLCDRLFSELNMTRAIKSIPIVKLPIDNPPPDYWQPCDIGSVRQTEEYPNPPSSGEYIWDPSESYSQLKNAIEQLSSSYNGADLLGANPAIIAEAKEKLFKAEKEFKILDVKNTNDKVLGIEAAIKAAKKARKKNNKGKSKKAK